MRSSRLGLAFAAVAVFVLLVGVPSAFGHSVPDFEDVPEGHVAETAIRWAAENEVTFGVGGNRFGIGETLTRYQMVTFLCRAFDPGNCESGVRGSDSFDDVPADHWANYSVGWAVNQGITRGVSATEFGGSQTLTREQMITFLYRAEGSPTGGSDGIDVFQDAPDRSHWASLSIGWAYDEGVTGGIAAGTFGFGTNVSREEMVLFLCRTAAPGTCQPSQQPLLSSVVPTSTTGSDDSDTTGADDVGINEAEVVSEVEGDGAEEDGTVPFLYPWATYNQGTKPVHVFYCARQGKYSNEDLADVVDLLNSELSPRWMRESSNMLTLVFTEGAVFSPDLDWDNVFLEVAQQKCRRDALQAVYPSRDFSGSPGLISEQILLLVDTPNRRHDGYGGNSSASSLTRELLGLNRFLFVVSHELGHSKIGLHHTLVDCGPFSSLMVNTGGHHIASETCVDGGKTLGSGVRGWFLACYERRLLGWPVGGDSPPCGLLPPSSPSGSLSSVVDDGFTVQWTPPVFSDDVPVDGYTLTVVRRDGGVNTVLERHELSVGERSFTVEGLPLGSYSIRMWAESEYGSGAPYTSPFLPFIPSPASVSVTEVTSTTFKVSWDPVPGASEYLVWNSEDDPPDIFEIDNEGHFRSFGGTVVSDGTSLVLHNRQPDTEYTVKVRACGFEEVFGSEECSFGTEVTVSTTPPEPTTTAPRPVSSVSVTDVGDDWLVLSWDPVPGATAYECGYLTGDNTQVYGPVTSDSSCELSSIGLEAGNTYTVWVLACREEPLYICSEATNANASTRALPSAPPTYPISVKEVGDTWVTLSWDPPAADAYYSVRVDGDGGIHWRFPKSTGEVTVRPLDPDTDYTIKVRTCRETTGICDDWVAIPVSTLRSN